jgi:hypothetical protein
MELFKEIILEGLKNKKIELSFPHVDVEKIVHDKSYIMLLEIKYILENDRLSHIDCVERIEYLFKDFGGLEFRHDFG